MWSDLLRPENEKRQADSRAVEEVREAVTQQGGSVKSGYCPQELYDVVATVELPDENATRIVASIRWHQHTAGIF
jgi:uncharacterized protein with GYD domain